MHAMWVTHGMVHACYVGDTWHDAACMPCGYVQPIKRGSVEEKRGKKEERERERGRGRKIRQLLHLISSVLTVRVHQVES